MEPERPISVITSYKGEITEYLDGVRTNTYKDEILTFEPYGENKVRVQNGFSQYPTEGVLNGHKVTFPKITHGQVVEYGSCLFSGNDHLNVTIEYFIERPTSYSQNLQVVKLAGTLTKL